MSKRARQANAPGGRSVRRVVKLTELEDNALMLRAANLGVSVQRFMVESALAHEKGETVTARHDAIETLLRLERQLSAVGNNLNQIARVANATGEMESELDHSLGYLRRTLAAVIDAAETVGRPMVAVGGGDGR